MAYKSFTTEVVYATDVETYLMNQAIIVCTSTTRPTPITNMRIWETDTLCERIYKGGQWVLIKENNIFKIKSTELVFGNIGPGENAIKDDELSITFTTPGYYLVDIFISYEHSATVHGYLYWILEPFSNHRTSVMSSGLSTDASFTTFSTLMKTGIIAPDLYHNAIPHTLPVWSTFEPSGYSIREKMIQILAAPVTMTLCYTQATAFESEFFIKTGSFIWARMAEYSGL